MRDILVTLLVLATIPMILARPHVGILVWNWLSFMNPHRLTFGFAYGLPFAQIIAVFTLVMMFFKGERLRMPWCGVVVVWLVFIVWVCVTTLFAVNPDEAWPALVSMLKIQIFTLLTVLTMATPERIKSLVWVTALSIAYFGIKGGIWALLTGGHYRVYGPSGTFLEDNNDLAFALIMVVPLLRFLQLQAQGRWLRRGLLIGMVLCVVAVLSSYSRGALIAMGGMAGMLWWKGRHKGRIALAVLVVAPLLWFWAPQEWHQRMGTVQNYEQDASAMSRIHVWTFAYQFALDHPVLGGGFKTFTPELFAKYAPEGTRDQDAHSVYFQVLAEHGFVGLGLFLLLWVLTFRLAGRVRRRTRDDPEHLWQHDLAAMLQVSLVGYALGGAFLGRAYFDLYYFLMALVVLLHATLMQAVKLATPAEQGIAPWRWREFSAIRP